MIVNNGNSYFPDSWVIVKIGNIYKVLGGWKGGYTLPDEWRLNSGIKSYSEEDGVIYFNGYSGSRYVCAPHGEGTTSLTFGVLQNLKSAWGERMIIQEIDYSEFIKEFKSE